MKAEAQSSSPEKGEQYLSVLFLFTGVLAGAGGRAEGGTKPKPKRTKMHELSTLRDSQKKRGLRTQELISKWESGAGPGRAAPATTVQNGTEGLTPATLLFKDSPRGPGASPNPGGSTSLPARLSDASRRCPPHPQPPSGESSTASPKNVWPGKPVGCAIPYRISKS